MSHVASVEQLALPGLEHRAKRVAEDEPAFIDAPPEDVDARPECAPAEGQLALFDDYTQLWRDLHDAVSAGRFEQALELRTRLEDEYTRADTQPFAFLDELVGDDLWRGTPRQVLARATEVACEPFIPTALAACLPRAVALRLVAQHGADAVVRDAPQALPLVHNALAGREPGTGDGDGRALARRLVRDALLAGRVLAPLEYDDPALRELLAEDLDPRWLACLGVVRRAWPVTRGDAPEHGAPDDALDPDDDDARAAAFWRCLQVTEDRAAPEAAVHAARKRMKRLHPGLHAACLKRLV